MKIFLVFQKQDDDYSSLPKDAEIVTLFRYIKGSPNIEHIKSRCASVLDAAGPEDFIVFNGPSYLCSIAGYVWFSQEERTHMNFYSFNKQSGTYHKHDEPIHIETKDYLDPDTETV